MAQSTRQTNLLVQQDWTKIYQTFTNANFTSYDFETLRSSMIDYLKTYYPETFNDFTESSEYIALIDMIAFLGQSLAFRADLNARENFIDTAQRRDSILKLARMLSYNPHRTNAASGLLKIDSVKTTESVLDSNGINLSGATIHWNDLTNDNWLEQFSAIVNASLVSSQAIGKSGNSQKINGIQTDEYSISLNPNTLPVAPFSVNVRGTQISFEAVSGTSVGKTYIYADNPVKSGQFNLLYRNDNNGNGSNNTGFFVFFKQGSLNATTFNIQNSIPNNFVQVATNNITNDDQWLYSLDVNNTPTTLWSQVPALPGVNVVFNNSTEKNLYQVNTLANDQVNLVFGDGAFANIPQGQFKFFYRTSNGTTYTISPDSMSSVSIGFSYISKKNTVETLTITASLKYTVTNANATPSLSSIKSMAPQQYYTQNRMITGEDYNIFPITNFTSIQKIKAVNRTSSGVSLYLDAIDPTGSYSSTNIFASDGVLSANNTTKTKSFSFLTTNDIYSAIYNQVIPTIDSTEVRNYYYGTTMPLTPDVDVTFQQVSTTTLTSSGYLVNSGNVQQIGTGVDGNLQYINTGASLAFTASPAATINATVVSTVPNTSTSTPNLLTFGSVVPDGALITSIIPPYKNSLSTDLIATLVSQIQAKSNFGLTYNQSNQVWENILPADIASSTDWLLKFNYSQGLYTITYKVIEYTMSSYDAASGLSETNFYFDPTTRVYDSVNGTTVSDVVKILKINTNPNDSYPIGQDIGWQIYNTVLRPDGYANTSSVLVKSTDRQLLGVPDSPNLFSTVVGPIPADGNSLARPGLYFQYIHNAPARSRIDPTPVNIIDLYILTSAYTVDYINWLRDLTGTVVEPTPPTSSSLETEYSTLDNFKAVSDTIVYNPAKFKPLFGTKADATLQARFQVIKNAAVGLTDNEIKTQVVSAINNYFDISQWDFGDTFYFSELAAYLHTTLAPNISSVLIVPKDNSLVFGNYFQINAEPWEIITSAATVNDIDIVSAVTAAQLSVSGVNFVGTP